MSEEFFRNARNSSSRGRRHDLARHTARINHKVSTTAAASNKQGDVERVNFGLDDSNNLVKITNSKSSRQFDG